MIQLKLYNLVLVVGFIIWSIYLGHIYFNTNPLSSNDKKVTNNTELLFKQDGTTKEHAEYTKIVKTTEISEVTGNNQVTEHKETEQPSALVESLGVDSEVILPANVTSDMTSTAGGTDMSHNRQHIVLLASFRGGSSFLGEIFNQNSDVLYWFEPLHHVYYSLQRRYQTYREAGSYLYNNTTQELREMPNAYVEQMIAELSLYLDCNVTNNADKIFRNPFITWTKQAKEILINDDCNYNIITQTPSTECVEQVQDRCKKYNYSVVKTIRLAIYMVKQLMANHPGMLIIHYVRDPRGTINARNNYLQGNDQYNETLDAVHLCHTMYQDYLGIQDLPDAIRARVLTVKYEDLALDPVNTAQIIYDFTGIAMKQTVLDWLQSNTNHTINGRYSTSKKSDETASRWRRELSKDTRRNVELVCKDVLDVYNYGS